MAVPSKPLTKETANPNAATAAASAFMRREPSVSLSSAAAAAALKARPATPTNVSQVQSKRAMRRSASVSSTGSRDRGRRELQRTPSQSSMTERTFRSPSPSPARGAPSNTHDVPPVPKLPNHDHLKTESKPTSHKRAMSLQVQPFQTASQKMKDGQGSWFGAPTSGDISNVRRAAVADKRASADLRPSSPSSINFSYPRSMLEPLAASDNAMVYDPNSRRMVPRAELLLVEQRVRNASEKPVRRHKNEGSRSGTHLSKGTVGRIKGTAVEPAAPPPTVTKTTQTPTDIYSTVTQEQTPEPKKAPPQPQPEPEPESESELESDLESEPEVKAETKSDLSRQQTLVESESELESEVEEPVEPKSIRAERIESSPAAVVLPDASVRKRPSVVHEVSDEEEEPEPQLQSQSQPQPTTQPAPQHRPTDIIDAVPVKSSQPSQPEPSKKEQQEQVQPASIPAPIEKPNGSIRRTRMHSESPARSPGRTTHFAPTTDQLLVRHEPPPRSVSPRKSALKHASPTRDASPSEDGSEASNSISGLISQDDGLSRRRSVRVSFDDQNTTVVGESAEPSEPEPSQIPSPQAKKPWHNIIGRYKRDSISLDDDEKMTPRPALPSFGSIREKKARETEERPLVRPLERSLSPPYPPANNRPVELEQSSDHAIGSVLAREQSSRNEANISKYREPLPLVVTSVESSGYISNSDLSSDVDSDDNSTPSDYVPTISITQPSPRIPDESRQDSPQDFFDVPGGFPDEVKGGSGSLEISNAIENASSTTKPTKTVVKPAPITPQRSFESTTMSPPSPQMHDIQEESEESDGSSIYSDAYEDLSDIEGDGFMSLNAVVESPIEPMLPKKVFEKAIAKSKEASKEADASLDATTKKDATQTPLQTPNDWENAKAYWRSLSAKERRQLEKEAMEDSDEETAPVEVVQPVKPKQKKHKKQKAVEKPQESPTKTSSEHRDPNRVYQISPGTTWPRDEVEEPRVKAVAKEVSKPAGGSKLRKSMRGHEAAVIEQSSPPQSVSMRKSMRSGAASTPSPQEGHFRKSLRPEPEATAAAGTGMRKSLRANGSPASVQKSSPAPRKDSRPASYQPAATIESAQAHRRHHSEERAPIAKPSLRRQGSDSSESSFRRARVGGGEGMGFRRTMRGSVRDAPAPASDGGRGSGRFSLRSLSPAGSAFRRNSNTSSPPPVVMNNRMRHSLRGDSSDASSSRMRVSGFGRKGKKARGGSRFDDSSDEDDARPAFSSRFVDSSEDEGTPTPRPKQKRVPRTMRNQASSNAAAAAMGVTPSHVEDEDSPDLPDSDDEPEQPQPAVTNGTTSMSPRTASTLKRSGSGRESLGALPPAQTAGDVSMGPRPSHKRRGSFMSSILRRKKDPSDKISRNHSESASRRDTRLERSTEELAVIRSNSGSHPHNARLQKRGANWPLQDGHHAHEEEDRFDDGSQNTYVVDEERRPSTAGGPGPSPTSPTVKTGFLKRRSTSHSAISATHNAPPASVDSIPEGSETGTPRKKKFGTLRKMFRLDD
ncbi:uncharacterized protein NECHADRAFT_35639 [Fusarium vanettenii 77-13-4]|uniref:Uncharacterized protein n=1 Tax=Fusarium vanettenii (strain ATCC MYA-4622 / CBS 123669 / FGSC 9596 / NRRL 45880 / 77-13-4) TaxID=660122 RepID=C7YLU8_FUSV7|nr:uncharacterized protein NECHADRAFT_35639 [Fusarium vanettenii 77-13-4]EEU47334.1 hypothetical protein NECHADRAFT_35639 [Fusarium vanettenii 77-13-4]